MHDRFKIYTIVPIDRIDRGRLSRPAGSFVIGVRVVFPYDRSDRLNIISDEHMETSLFRNNIYKNNEVKICPKIRNHIRSKCIFLLTKQNS